MKLHETTWAEFRKLLSAANHEDIVIKDGSPGITEIFKNGKLIAKGVYEKHHPHEKVVRTFYKVLQ